MPSAPPRRPRPSLELQFTGSQFSTQPLSATALGGFLLVSHAFNPMTNHDWAANAAHCAARRANEAGFGTGRYNREFQAFGDLAVMDWRWNEHPPHLGGRVN